MTMTPTEQAALTSGSPLARMDWSKLAQTRVARPVPRSVAEKGPLPLLSPVVGDHIRYTVNGVEVQGVSARGYVLMGQPVEYETYCDPADWPYPPR